MNEIVQNAIEKVKTVFSSVKNKIIELYFDNKKVFFLFLSLCFIIFLCIVLLIFIPKEKKESQNNLKTLKPYNLITSQKNETRNQQSSRGSSSTRRLAVRIPHSRMMISPSIFPNVKRLTNSLFLS